MTVMARIDEQAWIRCGNCSHKLGKMIAVGDAVIEIKCHSCKTINKCVITKSEESK